MVRDTISVVITTILQMAKFKQRGGKFWSELVVSEKAPGCHTGVLVTRLYFRS